MADHTVVQRIKRQREARLAEGWEEVRVWVPTEADASDVRRLAAKRRAKAEALNGLEDKIQSKTLLSMRRTVEAIASQGSSAYVTPSGPVLTLLTELAAEGDLIGLSSAFIVFARAKPSNAAFVAASVPAKISNNYLLGRLGLKLRAFSRWEASNGDWPDRIRKSLRDPDRFKHLVDDIANAIRATVLDRSTGDRVRVLKAVGLTVNK